MVLTLTDTVITQTAESHCKAVLMDLKPGLFLAFSGYFLRPFTQTILNMEYLIINTLIPYS